MPDPIRIIRDDRRYGRFVWHGPRPRGLEESVETRTSSVRQAASCSVRRLAAGKKWP
jgi:hypothetical protein